MRILILIGILIFIIGCQPIDEPPTEAEQPADNETEPSDEVTCPSSLYKEYKFFYSPSKVFLKDNLLENLSNKEGKCVTCESEEGFRHCEEIQYGDIFVDLLLKEVRSEEREGPERTFGLKALMSCSEVPDIQGTWTYYEVEDMKCFSKPQTITSGCGDGKCVIGEGCLNCPEDCGNCPKGTTIRTTTSDCGPGLCYSNGKCCPINTPYYCYRTDKCHASQQDAMTQSQGACSSFKVSC